MEEIMNAVTHGIGAVAAAVGLVFLVLLAYEYGSVWHIVSFSIYGATLFLMYLMNMESFSVQKECFRQKMEHGFILIWFRKKQKSVKAHRNIQVVSA